MEVKDPEVGFVSVSDVEVTRDLAHAKVYITVFKPEEAAGSIKALKRASGYLRRRLSQEMRIRSVPELHFLHDHSVETGERIDNLDLPPQLLAVEGAVGGDFPRARPRGGRGCGMRIVDLLRRFARGTG